MRSYQDYNWKNEKFLVADDDVYSLILLEKILQRTGASVVTASDGFEAVRIIQEDTSISIAILDIVMPKLTGYDVVEQTNKIRPDLIYVACTADILRINANKCQDYGFAACLSKPFLPIRLFSILEEVLLLRSQTL
jgi:CheY-like chemotaxis protein